MNSLKIKFIWFVFFISPFCYSQNDSTAVESRDILDVIRKIFKKDDSISKQRKLAFSLLPIPVGANNSNGLVVSFLTTFYLGKNHETTNMSQVSFSPYFSFSKQYVFPIQSYVYTKDNKWNFIGDYRYMIYPQLTYGLGDHNLKEEMSTLDYQQWRFYQFVTRKVIGNYRLGIGFLYDNYQNISEDSYIDEETDYVKYMNGDFSDETSFGFAFQGLYDSRKNIVNPEGGLYVEADLRINTSGVDGNKWQSLYFDARKYHSFSKTKHRVWASRAFYWSTFGGKPHYLDLPSIGWDRDGKTGRGFTKNRYRSNALIYLETEYRTDITRNGFFGAVFFGNISSVSKLETYQFDKWHPAIGTGIRIKWNKKNNSNLALDYGVSKNDWSLRLGLTENF